MLLSSQRHFRPVYSSRFSISRRPCGGGDYGGSVVVVVFMVAMVVVVVVEELELALWWRYSTVLNRGVI